MRSFDGQSHLAGLNFDASTACCYGYRQCPGLDLITQLYTFSKHVSYGTPELDRDNVTVVLVKVHITR
jgi:hypothetical protein